MAEGSEWNSEWIKNVLAHPFIEYLLSIHSVPGVFSALGMSPLSEQNRGPTFVELSSCWGDVYQISEVCCVSEGAECCGEKSSSEKGWGVLGEV